MTFPRIRSVDPSERLARAAVLALIVYGQAAGFRGPAPPAGRGGKTLTIAVVPMGTTPMSSGSPSTPAP